MKPIDPLAFDRKQTEAIAPAAAQDAHVIRAQMNRSDWLILGLLALIWGGRVSLSESRCGTCSR
jgi:hypothetical protein